MSLSAKAPEGAKEVEDFYGVYLLYCMNPKYKGRTYIGYTRDPNRRISQHNRGTQAGGAWRTSNKGPWEMVLIIHGFPNDISALRFEWAWQHPQSSRRLNGLPPKKSREKSYDFCMRLVASMLNLGPWHKLPLTVRWLKPEFKVEFPSELQPPLHMPIVYGPVKSKSIGVKKQKKKKSSKEAPEELIEYGETASSDDLLCNICFTEVTVSQRVVCLYPKCKAVSHILCLGREFTKNTEELLPVKGNCPTCGGEEVWGNIIRKKRGCYEELEEDTTDGDEDDYDYGD